MSPASAAPARGRLRRALSAFALAALLGTALSPAHASAEAEAPEGPECVSISEVNASGGSSASPHPRYVELHNSCETDVDVSGWSVQGYQSSGTLYNGGSRQLSGSVPAGGHYLILGPGNGQEPLLHDHDAGYALNTAGGGASVVVFSTPEPAEVSGDVSDHPDVVDALGWGGASIAAGEPAPAADNPLTLHRTQSTGSNAQDFSAAEPTPMYSGGSAAGEPGPGYQGPETLLISEVYTQGGEPGSVYQHRYVELYNYGTEDIDLTEWSLQYGNAAGTYNGNLDLTGTVPAGEHFLIAFDGARSGAGAPLNDDTGTSLAEHADQLTEDYFGTLSYSFALTTAPGATTIPDGPVEQAEVVDALGYGQARYWAGEAPSPGPEDASEVVAVQRTSELTGSSTDNASDFALSAELVATNSAGEDLPGERSEPGDPGDPGDPEGPTDIRQIRGEATTDPSDNPMIGESVTIEGFVTARYADAEHDSRAHDGFYVQQEAACGEADFSDLEVSCAIFVYMGTSWDGAEVSAGDYVEVTGTVDTWRETGAAESMQLQITSPQIEVIDLQAEGLDVVEPLPYVYEGFVEASERERLIGMLIEPAGDWTVTDNYGLLHGEPDSVGGVLGIVDGTEPLWTPTAQHAPGPEAEQLQAQNDQRYIRLGHGGRNRWASFAFDRHMPLPYLQSHDTVRVGAAVDFTAPVVLEHRYDGWRFEPTSFLPGNPEAEPVSIENTRPQAQLPEPAGDLRLAGFNVLNYFPHVGQQFADCGYYEDRFGEPTTTRDCTPRGAYTEEHFAVQQSRIVETITAMDADVVALQEIENSRHFGEDRDYAHQRLVEALNAAEGEQTWDFVPVETAPEDEDVIRNGFIYKPEAVELVDALILFDDGVAHLDSDALDGYDLEDIYSNAREPMAAIFQPVGGSEEDQFVTVVNHLKSKGCSGAEGGNADQGDGQACYNPDRVQQAEALAAFTEAVQDHYGTEKSFLMGDFNAHAQEDPMRALYEQGFTNESLGQASYMFSGEIGALDHVLTSDEASEAVAQTHIWNTNAFEPIALEYSRYEASGTPGLYEEPQWSSQVWRASDHDPIVVDVTLTDGEETPAWDAEAVYTGGETVVHDGAAYTALWWTQNQEPGASDWSAWSEIGEPTTCGGETYPAWASSTEFTGGETVVHQGGAYTAKWYSRSQQPGDPYGPWEKIGDC
ncbi:ExeM/NucH family extracellular endonuclease [Nesterenkonia sp.]|uniref:ExeM/NucH family extracellular endonuclease n=1 Tax=Nesterenkonia sp. TaxID=704201 RepID=UPI00261CDF13|nr:ExeM/NucH family extracellular endonuclease [Nesterenkonia sp.]